MERNSNQSIRKKWLKHSNAIFTHAGIKIWFFGPETDS